MWGGFEVPVGLSSPCSDHKYTFCSFGATKHGQVKFRLLAYKQSLCKRERQFPDVSEHDRSSFVKPVRTDF